jgi:alpha-tubulin suppressor-like RCC1 family protein
VTKIACGEDFSMAVSTEGYLFSAGSSEFGQLGNGETGEYIVTAGKTGFTNSTLFARRSTFCYAPDDNGSNNKVVKVVPIDESDIRIEKVACGKHHSVAIEMPSDDYDPPRVFSWGNGGYGCLGTYCILRHFACSSEIRIVRQLLLHQILDQHYIRSSI